MFLYVAFGTAVGNTKLNQSINQIFIVPISPVKPGSVARQANQCSTAKSRKINLIQMESCIIVCQPFLRPYLSNTGEHHEQTLSTEYLET